MITLTDYHFWFSLLLFFPVLFVSFYLPGIMIMRLFPMKGVGITTVLALCLGFVLWAAQGYIFGYTQIRWMTYVYLVITLGFAYKNRAFLHTQITQAFSCAKQNFLLIIVVLLGMILQCMHMFGSGLVYADGMHFLGANGVDGVMHLAYIQELATHFPPYEPGAYQLPLRNYHYWLDISIAELVRIWHFSPQILFFQGMPLFFSIMTGSATYLVMKVWTNSKKAGLWALFFLYFAGDGAYLFMLILHQTFGFYTPAIDNGITQFLNMPHGAAKMVFTVSLIPLYFWIKTSNKRWGILMVVLFASLVGFKVYYGIFVAIGLSLVVSIKIINILVKNRAKKKPLLRVFSQESFTIFLLVCFISLSAAIFLPPNSGSGGLGWYPLEWPKIFLGQDNLNIREWWLRMQVYEQAHNMKYIILYDLFAIIVGLICIQGTRLIGLFPTKSLVKLLGWEHLIFFVPGIVLFHFLGLFTLQKAGSFNVFNFFVVAGVVMSLFSGYVCYRLFKRKRWWAYLLLFVIVITTVPRAWYEIIAVTNALVLKNGAYISREELSALSFIRNTFEADAIIQSHPRNIVDSQTTYIAYFSGRKTYISGITMIASHGQSIEPMQANIKYLFSLTSATKFAEGLRKQKIGYIYLQKKPEQSMIFVQNSIFFKKVFENDSVIVYKVI